MAPTDGRVAKPERRWDCRLGTPTYKLNVQCSWLVCLHTAPRVQGQRVSAIQSRCETLTFVWCQALEHLHQRRSADDDHVSAARSYLMAVVITNLTQAIWFAANFLLYSGCTSSSRSGSSASYCRLSVIDAARVSSSRYAAYNVRWSWTIYMHIVILWCFSWQWNGQV